jgi:hypothetical protein
MDETRTNELYLSKEFPKVYHILWGIFGASYASSRILSFIMLDIKENPFWVQ